MARRTAVNSAALALAQLASGRVWPPPDRIIASVVSVDFKSLPLSEQFLNVDDPLLNSERHIKIEVHWPDDRRSLTSWDIKGRFDMKELTGDRLNRRLGNLVVQTDPFLPNQTLCWHSRDSFEQLNVNKQINVLPENWATSLVNALGRIQSLRTSDQESLLNACKDPNPIFSGTAFALLMGKPELAVRDIEQGFSGASDEMSIATRTVLALESKSLEVAEWLQMRATTITDDTNIYGMSLGAYVFLRYRQPEVVKQIDQVAALKRLREPADEAISGSLRSNSAVRILTILARLGQSGNQRTSGEDGLNVAKLLAFSLRLTEIFEKGF